MRQLLTITLLLIHVFNTAGYNLLFGYFSKQADVKLVQRLDRADYSDDQLMLLKTPMNLPYYTPSTEVERVDGQIELEGVHYNYVKRKISNDTLYLYCIPNREKTKLGTAKADFARSAGDATGNQKGDHSLLKKIACGAEYSTPSLHYSFAYLDKMTQHQRLFLLLLHAAPFVPAPAKPPEQA